MIIAVSKISTMGAAWYHHAAGGQLAWPASALVPWTFDISLYLPHDSLRWLCLSCTIHSYSMKNSSTQWSQLSQLYLPLNVSSFDLYLSLTVIHFILVVRFYIGRYYIYSGLNC